MPPETRDKILQAARRLFHEQGFAATGISTICREAGVNAGSLYHFFERKEDLLLAVLDMYIGGLGPLVMDPQEAAHADPIDRIFGLLAWYRDGMVQTGCRLGCPIGNLALEVSDSSPDARPKIDTNFQNWAKSIEAWLLEAGDALPPETDRGALATFVLTVMEGGLMQARAADELGPFDSSVAVLRSHFAMLRDRADAVR